MTKSDRSGDYLEATIRARKEALEDLSNVTLAELEAVWRHYMTMKFWKACIGKR